MGEGPKDSRKAPSFDGLQPASKAASRAKRANRKKDSRHEVLLRRELWKLGVRYRKYVAKLPGNPDLVFRGARVVVFCDGDFWHGRNWDQLRAALGRRHNADYWIAMTYSQISRCPPLQFHSSFWRLGGNLRISGSQRSIHFRLFA